MNVLQHVCLSYSVEVKGHLGSGLLTDALLVYKQLSSLSVTMETSDCSHLRRYILSSKTHWHSRLTEKLSRCIILLSCSSLLVIPYDAMIGTFILTQLHCV